MQGLALPDPSLPQQTSVKFSFNAKRVYLTYPRCPLSKEVLIEELGKIKPITYYAVCNEVHQDGTPHLHAVIHYSEKVHRKDVRAFDVLGHHPNIKKVPNNHDLSRIIEYITKDGSFISTFPDRRGKLEILAEEILSKGLNYGTLRKNPSLMFKNLNNIKQWLTMVPTVICSNIPKNKSRHTWLFGPSNTGKTTWLNALKSLYTCVEIPSNNDFSELIDLRGSVEILYFDEFKGDLTIQALNKICDGDTLLNTKGGSVRLRYVWVVIVSNYSIPFCYVNSDVVVLTSLYNRFRQYDSSINLPKFPKYNYN